MRRSERERAREEEKHLLARTDSEKKGKRGEGLVSGLAYCASSMGMILLNKLVLSSYKWNAQISLMMFQNLISVSIVVTLSLLGLVTIEPLSWKLIRVWLPVNVIFVGMLVTSFFSLKYIGVGMVTILKNVTNLVTAVGEIYLFNKVHSKAVWLSLLLMIISAVCGGLTDLEFHATGYAWQLLNCLFTAAYSLTLRRVMDIAKASTKSGTLNEFSMVYLNNILSVPLGTFLVILLNEAPIVVNSPLIHNVPFVTACVFSGVIGLSISFTSMWFLHATSPTTYSIVGSLNKVPLSLAGMLLFSAQASAANVASILFGCFAGVMFAWAKQLESKRGGSLWKSIMSAGRFTRVDNGRGLLVSQRRSI